MPPKLVRQARPLTVGYQEIISAEKESLIGMTLGTWKLAPADSVIIKAEGMETAVLALAGDGSLACGGRSLDFSRHSWIETSPTVIHAGKGSSIEVTNSGSTPVEVVVIQTPNTQTFKPRYYAPSDINVEHRGKGLLGDTCYRLVRLVFDDTNGPPESNLVLGEVINLAGRWSSYPPHHHPQPEIYYYRFDPPNGFGYGELGEEVFKIRGGDLLVITDNNTHCQTTAPGYNMYYLWAIRHLPGNRYQGFIYEPDHAWTLKERDRL